MIPRHTSNRNSRRQAPSEIINLDGELFVGSAEGPFTASGDLQTLPDSKNVRAIERRLEAIDAELREIRSRLVTIDRCLSRCVHRKAIFETRKSQLLTDLQSSAFYVRATSARRVSPGRKARVRHAAAALKGGPGRRRKYNRNGE
jgi:hypothetical protein